MKRTILTFLGSVLASLLLAAPAGAAFGVNGFDLTFEEEGGGAAELAGSHPFEMTTVFSLETHVDPDLGEVPDASLKNLDVRLPAGFAGNPSATPRCSGADFGDVSPVPPKLPACSNETVVGVAAVRVKLLEEVSYFGAPVYNLEHPPGAPAKLGLVVLGVPVTLRAQINPSPPYNVEAEVTNVSQALAFYGASLTLWGDPSAASHDGLRGSCVDVVKRLATPDPVSTGDSCPVPRTEKAFLTLPTACRGQQLADFEANSWQDPGSFVTGSSTTPLEVEGCESVVFDPEMQISPTASSAEGGSGLEVSIDVDDPGLVKVSERAESTIEKAVVTLPEGITVNPSQAEGLGACSEAQLAAATPDNPGCPGSSKIGTVDVQTPLLEGELLQGSLYVAEPFANRFGTLVALYVVIRDADLGIVLPLAGKVELDPATGRLTSTFEDLPQVPFSSFDLHFRSGGRSPLVLPPTCGTYEIKAVLAPWSNPSVPLERTSSFEVTSGPNGGPCPSGTPPFSPRFEAGSTDNRAGAFSPFYMRVSRADGEGELRRLSAVLPPGLTGKLAGVERCPQAAVDGAKSRDGALEKVLPSCPAGSQIGRTTAGAGVGSELTYVDGRIYLGGPYDGNPLSIVAIVPAVAGPFDLGTVVVQEGLDLNPDTAEVEVDGSSSDPFPLILEGVPLRLRELEVATDRPGFTLNPTNCETLATKATLSGLFRPFDSGQGASASLASPYTARSCARLGFKPKLALRMKGGTKRGDHPAVRAVVTPRKGDANIGRTVVLLPPTEQIDNAHINNPCTRVQFAANDCPKGSILGKAVAKTPLLDEPLRGKVYFRSNGGERLLPDIVADLKGQFRIVLVGAVIGNKKGRLRTTFASVPDAPVSKFVLSLKGGKAGLLVHSRNICAIESYTASVKMKAQNGRKRDFEQPIRTSCKKPKRK